MTRIAELPFSDSFYELDKKNLSIPIILNQASPIDLRIKAATIVFWKINTVDSLAFICQWFYSDQFNNPQKTIDSLLNNKELSMAFISTCKYSNFPNDRLNVLIQFWDFAKK